MTNIQQMSSGEDCELADDNDSLQILLVALNSSFGGVERHLVDLSPDLAKRGHEVTLVAPRRSVLAATARTFPDVKVIELSGSPMEALSLRRLYKNLCPDIVHLHSPRASVIGRAAARLLSGTERHGITVISTAHGWISVRLRLRLMYQWIYNKTATWEDGIIAVSEAVRETLEENQYPNRIYVVPNGISPDWTHGLAASWDPGERPLRLGYFGRLEGEKGFNVLVEALKRVRSDRWQLSVYGDGRDRTKYEKSVRLAGLDRQVRFARAIPADDVPGSMANCHAVVLPSLQEGCPYVVLEALSLGVPIVGSAVGGVPDLVRDGKDGLLVPPGQPDALAHAIRRLIEDPELLSILRQNALDRQDDFTSRQMTDRLVSVYRSAVAEHQL
jgi:glycosyltransferase involved in cell wall biosynthesis